METGSAHASRLRAMTKAEDVPPPAGCFLRPDWVVLSTGVVDAIFMVRSTDLDVRECLRERSRRLFGCFDISPYLQAMIH